MKKNFVRLTHKNKSRTLIQVPSPKIGRTVLEYYRDADPESYFKVELVSIFSSLLGDTEAIVLDSWVMFHLFNPHSDLSW